MGFIFVVLPDIGNRAYLSEIEKRAALYKVSGLSYKGTVGRAPDSENNRTQTAKPRKDKTMRNSEVIDQPEDHTGFWGDEPMTRSPLYDDESDSTVSDPADFDDIDPDDRSTWPAEFQDDEPVQLFSPNEDYQEVIAEPEQAEESAEAYEETVELGLTAQPTEPSQPVTPTPEPDDDDDIETLLREIESEHTESNPTIQANSDILAKGEAIKSQTVIFDFKFTGKSFRRKVKSQNVVAAEHLNAVPMLSTNKSIIDCPELDAIRRVVREFKDWLYFQELPSSLLRGGMRLIPLANVNRVEDRFAQTLVQFRAALKAFIVAYPQRKAEARQRLGNLYRESEYPTAREIRNAYRLTKRWVSFDPPQALKQLNTEVWKQNSQQLAAQMAEAGQECKEVLRARMVEYTQWLVERLTADPGDTKRKAIAESKIEDFRQFLASFESLNLMGDAEMSAFVAQARRAVEGLDVKSLRSDDAARNQIREVFAGIQQQTEAWVTEQSRVIYDEDEI